MTAHGKATLRTWSGTVGDAQTVLSKFAAGSATPERRVGFSYAPRGQPRFFKLDAGGQAIDRENPIVNLAAAYELRLFDPIRDVRARRDGADWRVAVVSEVENDAVATALSLGMPAEMRAREVRDHCYLLWGTKPKGSGPVNGWTKLVSPRIGPLWAPFSAVANDDRIALTAREYFRIGVDGNTVFAGERLTGFKGVAVHTAEEQA